MKLFTAVPVFPVRDLEASLAYYTEILGFTETFRFGAYAGIEQDHVKLHLWAEGQRKPPGTGQAYLLCDEVDRYYAAITAKGAVTLSEPKTYPYSMRDFDLEDPDGNHLSFGAEAKE